MYDSRCAGHCPGSEVNGEDEDDDDETFDQIPVRDLDPLCRTDAEHDRNSEEKKKKKKKEGENYSQHHGTLWPASFSVFVSCFFSVSTSVSLCVRTRMLVLKFSSVVLNCACVRVSNSHSRLSNADVYISLIVNRYVS